MAAEGDRVVVIGAGIAGLVTAKVLRDDGFDVTVVEREATIGGVWAAFSPARYRDVAAQRRLARADERLTAPVGDTSADTPDAPLLP
ncbi:FAD-dependent oxidoreductase [Nocardia terpenica]|uniref:FAD-dependent oxidoreductase n=1 Tax=Nocardia terpenica TaxID=455432 RepID=A0A6G9Z9R2_9NOCA|nr:FAD-dependent oxidoreductase [Nocardia terpenica]